MLLLKPPTWLLLACASAAVYAENPVNAVEMQTHSLHQPYLDHDMQARFFESGGDAIVRTDQYIRLTPDKPSRNGWLWSHLPLSATNWEIEVEFAIHGKGHLHGDGMAMWVTKERMQQGPVFGNQDKFEGLGIFFDTYKNNRPGTVFPYVMAMVGDGNTAYDKNNDGKENELAGCSARGLRNQKNFPTKARLTYLHDKSLSLDLQYKSEGEWTSCFKLGPTKLPSEGYLGFTAETGELSDNHDIVDVSVRNVWDAHLHDGTLSPAEAKKAAKEAKRAAKEAAKAAKRQARAQGEGGGWGWFFVKFLLFGVAVAATYVGVTVWRSQRNRSRF